jgi:hypothetical protein
MKVLDESAPLLDGAPNENDFAGSPYFTPRGSRYSRPKGTLGVRAVLVLVVFLSLRSGHFVCPYIVFLSLCSAVVNGWQPGNATTIRLLLLPFSVFFQCLGRSLGVGR